MAQAFFGVENAALTHLRNATMPMLPMYTSSPIVYHPSIVHQTTRLVLTRSLLAHLKLIQIPSTNIQITILLIHTLLELSDLRLALRCSLIVLIHCILSGLILSNSLISRRSCLRASSKPAADCVADAGADCYTAVESSQYMTARCGVSDDLRCCACHLAEESWPLSLLSICL